MNLILVASLVTEIVADIYVLRSMCNFFFLPVTSTLAGTTNPYHHAGSSGEAQTV